MLPKHLASAAAKWADHEFYTTALVLGIDIGLQGIGLCLRKGLQILFAQTFLVGDPTRTLQDRRQKRAWRRALQSRKKRERLLKEWIVRHGILSRDRVNTIWNDPAIFQNAYELRLRGTRQQLGSPEALVACLRHGIKHRGYDYHLTGNSTYPWGDTLDYGSIMQWTKTGCCPSDAGKLWINLLQEADFSTVEEKLLNAERAIKEAIQRFEKEPIETVFKAHFRETKHTNLRERARGHAFPRELVKAHLRTICRNNHAYFTSGTFEQAVHELLGAEDSSLFNEAIIDYHRRTPEQIEKLWEAKIKPCPYAPLLFPELHQDSLPCDKSSNLDVRRFKLLQFLAERTYVLSNGNKQHADPALIQTWMNHLQADHDAIERKQPRPK